MMTKLRRLLRNVPVLRFGAASTLAVLIATYALLGAPALSAPPAHAAENARHGSPRWPLPEQAETAKKLLQSNETPARRSKPRRRRKTRPGSR